MSDDDSDGLLEDDSGGSDSDVVPAAKAKKAPAASKKRKAAADLNDSDDEEDDKPAVKKKKKKSSKPSWIDDAAEESGDDVDDDEDDEEDEDDENNDYVKDGFVVDEEEEDTKKKGDDDGLEDSDDDGDDDDDDDHSKGGGGGDHKLSKLKRKKIRRMDEQLDDDDLALINEARGIDVIDERAEAEAQAEDEAERRKNKIVAQNEAELRKGLFYDSGGEDDGGGGAMSKKQQMKQQQRRNFQVERYDEDGMDDFIDDDIGDQDDILNSDRRGAGGEGRHGEVTEAQMTEASEIFGTEYLNFMAHENTAETGDRDEDYEERELMGKRRSYREKGVGVDLGVDSEEDISDDDDIFDQDDDDDEDDLEPGITASQKAEALRLKRQKRELAEQERRQKAYQKKLEKRKAQLRKAFEPVQLIENFCTDRDDEIRKVDAPERFYDLIEQQRVDKSNERFPGGDDPMTAEEQEEAMWILQRIPAILRDYKTPPPAAAAAAAAAANPDAMQVDGTDAAHEIEKHQRAIIESIVFGLRYMLRDHFEPAMIYYYRADRVSSQSVRDNLHNVLEEDSEWERTKMAKTKVETLLETLTKETDKDEAAGSEEETILKLTKALEDSKQQLDDTAKKESTLKNELEEIKQADLAADNKDEDDDDNLFGNDEDDEEEHEKKKQEEEEVRLLLLLKMV